MMNIIVSQSKYMFFYYLMLNEDPVIPVLIYLILPYILGSKFTK